jgi:hypothetical protein
MRKTLDLPASVKTFFNNAWGKTRVRVTRGKVEELGKSQPLFCPVFISNTNHYFAEFASF